MLRRTLLAAALVLAGGVAPAVAAEKKAPDKAELQAVDLAAVGLPIVWQGRLVNYVFAYVRLPVAPNADLAKARTKEPYFRDALIRAAHRHPFVQKGDLTRIDEGALRAALLPEARRIAGPGVVTGVVVLSQQPQRRTGLPNTAAPAAAVERAPIP